MTTGDNEVGSDHDDDRGFPPRHVRGFDGEHPTSEVDSASGTELQHHDAGMARVEDDWLTPSEGEQEPLISLSQVISRRQITIGPLPPADELARYQEVRPDIVDVVLDMAKEDTSARTHTMRTTADAEAFAVRLGAIVALLLPILLIVLAAVLVAMGASPWVGAAIAAIAPALHGVSKIIEVSRSQGKPAGDADQKESDLDESN